jgi:hypothetical protein
VSPRTRQTTPRPLFSRDETRPCHTRVSLAPFLSFLPLSPRFCARDSQPLLSVFLAGHPQSPSASLVCLLQGHTQPRTCAPPRARGTRPEPGADILPHHGRKAQGQLRRPHIYKFYWE